MPKSIAATGWIVALVALTLAAHARLRRHKIDRLFGVSRRHEWDVAPLEVGLWMMLLVVVSVARVLVDSLRKRHRHSRYTMPLLTLCLGAMLAASWLVTILPAR